MSWSRRARSSRPPAVRSARRHLLALHAALAALGCAPFDSGIPEGGRPVDPPQARPSFVLTDTEGRRFDFRARTAGRPTFLFFGYTTCPDVCPVQLSNLAVGLRKLDSDQRRRAMVVFISVDPRRDSASAIREWLDAIDHDFIGLRGSEGLVDSIQIALGLPPTIRGVPDGAGNYEVGHAAPVFVFGADDYARVAFPFGTRQADWVKALPRLVRVGRGSRGAGTGADARAGVPGAGAPSGVAMANASMTVSRAYLVAPIAGRAAALYLEARAGATPDTLLGVNVDGATVALHRTDPSGVMSAAERVPVGGGAMVRLAPGGLHGMVAGLARPLTRGDSIAITLRFAGAGLVRARAAVISYADVDTATAPDTMEQRLRGQR